MNVERKDDGFLYFERTHVELGHYKKSKKVFMDMIGVDKDGQEHKVSVTLTPSEAREVASVLFKQGSL